MRRQALALKRIFFPSEATTLVEWGEGALKILQVRRSRGEPELLSVRVLPLSGAEEGTALKQAAAALPAPPGNVLLVLPKAQLLIRLLNLPMDDPGELSAMARYQLAGDLPYPIEDCSVSTQVIAQTEGKAKVLVVIVPRALLDRTLGILREAGLEPKAVAVASEGLARWHESLAPNLPVGPRLILETTEETLELAIVAEDKLLELRSLPLPHGELLGAGWLLTQVQETLGSYKQRNVGPPVAGVSVGGPNLTDAGILATLQEHLGLSVRAADPLASRFKEALAAQADQVAQSSFSSLLGLALRPRVHLDLLPAEIRQRQTAENRFRKRIGLFGWIALCLWLGALPLGLKANRHYKAIDRVKLEIAALQPQAASSQQMNQQWALVQQAQQTYADAFERLKTFFDSTPEGIALESVALESKHLTASGSAKGLAALADWNHRLSLSQVNADAEGGLSFHLEGTQE
ncbi:MAG: hypothetical protein HYZ73_02605 [Elusimicrobia bacterium]|nr:hypothetical protein [Elusimicrobiota bacterium]